MKKNKTGSGRYWLKPEEDFSRSGVVLAAERDQSKLSSRIVSNGLCHESFFRRLEQGLVGCEKVLANALLERMGVSPSRMLFYLNLWEEEYLLTREHWIRAIHEKNWMEAEYCQRQYQEQTQCFHDLHRQFSLLIGTAYGWERYRNEE